MKKSLIPYKKSIFRKIIDFIKGNKEQEVQKQETKSKETVNRFRNQIKVVDKYSEERKLTDQIINDNKILEQKTEAELDEIETKLLGYLKALQSKLKLEKKGSE